MRGMWVANLLDGGFDRLRLLMEGRQQLEHLRQPRGHVIRRELDERDEREHAGMPLAQRPPLFGALPRPLQRASPLGRAVEADESGKDRRARLANLVLRVAHERS